MIPAPVLISLIDHVISELGPEKFHRNSFSSTLETKSVTLETVILCVQSYSNMLYSVLSYMPEKLASVSCSSQQVLFFSTVKVKLKH